jgi:hypothetical protein
MLIVSVVITAAACAVGATIAGRAGLVAIPLGLGLRAITGFVLILAGASLGHHARLIDWGVTLLAAALAGAASDSRSPHGDDRRSQNPPQLAREFLEPGKPGLVPGVRVGSRRVPASAGELPAARWATAQITRICTVFESLELG